MIKHNLWSDDGAGMRYQEGEPRPWMLDSWTQLANGEVVFIRKYIGLRPHGTPPSGIFLRSMKQRHRIQLESSIAMEQYQ
jgi:hypothetical protein